MTWKHVAIICVAVACVVICGATDRCAGSIKEIIGLASIISVGVLGHAKDNASPPPPAPARARNVNYEYQDLP